MSAEQPQRFSLTKIIPDIVFRYGMDIQHAAEEREAEAAATEVLKAFLSSPGGMAIAKKRGVLIRVSAEPAPELAKIKEEPA